MSQKYNCQTYYSNKAGSPSWSNADSSNESFEVKSNYTNQKSIFDSDTLCGSFNNLTEAVRQLSKETNLGNDKASPYNDNENHLSDVDDDSDDVSSDDTADEDWVAADHDKRRQNRLSTSIRNQSVTPRKLQNHAVTHRKTIQKDRSHCRTSSNSSHHPNKVTFTKHNNISVGRPRTVSRDQSFSGSRKPKRQTCKSRTCKTDTTKQPSQKLPYELTKPRQCFGPGCTRAAARPDTKYCSDKCGIKLAIARLEVMLPDSLANSHSGFLEKLKSGEQIDLSDCMANRIDKSRLKAINVEQCSIQNRLIELEMEHQSLTNLIAKAQERKPERNHEYVIAAVAKDAEQVEQMEPIVCVTCSAEVSMRHALKHMERCFQKMEGNTVFCANQKEQIMGTPLFCDAYDSQAKAYCKRLRVVCEHYKEPKLPPDTICGSPLVRDVFIETGEVCCVPRNKCTRHFGWERLRRAKIDLERYRCLIQMDELMQEEVRIQRSISQRGGILGLLLHRTVDHNPSKPVPIPPDVKIT